MLYFVYSIWIRKKKKERKGKEKGKGKGREGKARHLSLIYCQQGFTHDSIMLHCNSDLRSCIHLPSSVP